MAKLLLSVSLGMLLFAAACGGGSSSSSSSSSPNSQTVANSVPLLVNGGPDVTSPYTNGAFPSVTICAPGSSSNCQTINGVLIDTGASGLRVLSSVLNVSLPQQTDSSGEPIGNCIQYADGSFNWGAVQTADGKMAGELAKSVPIQVIAGPNSPFAAPPSGCSSGGGTNENTLQSLGANAILGLSSFEQDCGPGCSISVPGTNVPNVYFACPSTGCRPVLVPIAQQIQNPVALFATDNNGIVIQLPAVSATGAPAVSGTLIFGIGTQSNNSIGNATVLTVDSQGNFTTVFKGQSFPASFLDTGSNGLFFLDSKTTGIPECTSNKGFYCPSATQNLTATNRGGNGLSTNVSFSIANADTLFANNTAIAFSNLGGPNVGAFDWGLPFFFGRTVFTAIEQHAVPGGGTGPFVAY